MNKQFGNGLVPKMRDSGTFCYNLSYTGQSSMYQYNDVTSPSRPLKSPVARLFVRQIIQANNKGNIKGVHHWPIGDRWILLTKC